MAAAQPPTDDPPTGIVQPEAVFTGEAPRGLVNMGNTCYLNSAVEALAHCPALVYYFHSCRPLYSRSAGQGNGGE